MSDKFVVNIGRQLGSGGLEIGKTLASRLGIDFYDKELINLASEESGLCAEFFERADERTQDGPRGLFSIRFPFISESSIPAMNSLSNDALFKVQSDVIRKLAEEKSCLFMGRCADYILRDYDRSVNIFITADKEDRIARLMKRHGFSAEDAERYMEKGEKKRAEYYNYYTSKKWGVASSYHLCINSSLLGIEGTVDFLESFIRRKLGL
jgi:cytidylate kinase